MFAVILNIFLILIILSLVVFLHELGHFLAAKWNGVVVEEFAVGMGPLAFSREYNGTLYSLRWIPIGGFVKMLGEGDDPDVDLKAIAKEDGSFQNISPLRKVSILIAGVFMNFMTAVLIYYGFLIMTGFTFISPSNVVEYEPWFGREYEVVAGPLEYSGILEDGNADEAGWPDKGIISRVSLVRNDAIPLINLDYVTDRYDSFIPFLKEESGNEVDVLICTDEKDVETCKNYITKVSEDGKVGIYLANNVYKEIEYTSSNKVFAGFVHSFNMIQLGGEQLGAVFSEASETGDYEEAINSVSSPIGLYFIVDFIRQIGVLGILDLIANISLSLFIMNLLPIPALDGGRIVLVGLESILGKYFHKGIEAWSIRISFIILLLFMLFMFAKDIYYFETLKNLF